MMCFRPEIVRRNYACYEDAERRRLALVKAKTEKASLLATGFITPPLSENNDNKADVIILLDEISYSTINTDITAKACYGTNTVLTGNKLIRDGKLLSIYTTNYLNVSTNTIYITGSATALLPLPRAGPHSC